MAETHKFKVVFGEPAGNSGVELLQYNPNFEVIVLKKGEDEKLAKELSDADALVVRSGIKVTPELLDNAPQLKIVGRAGAGVDNIDVEECSKRGIVVMRTQGGNSNGVVELTIGTMISLVRFIHKADKLMKEGTWAKGKLKGTELQGKTLGLVGLGKIGGGVAKIAEAIGMNIIALVRDKTKKRGFPFHGEFVDSLDELLPKADFVSLHLPANAHTKGMIGETELKKMKPSAYLINTSRGAITDEDALFNALKNGDIAGAAIDVYSTEPSQKDDFPFIELDNVIATPHLGATTVESQENVSQMICEHIVKALEDNVFIDAINLPFNIPGDKSDKFAPFLLLAKELGSFAGQWSDAEISSIEFTYRFRKTMDVNPITMMAATEILARYDQSVSLINIDKYLEQKGISTKVRGSTNLNFDDSFRIVLGYKNGEKFDIRGITTNNIPKVVEIQERNIEIVPRGHILVVINKNVPGVVGAVGSKLGEAKINISSMALSESSAGQDVIGCIVVDEEVPQEVIDTLKESDNIINIKNINF